MPVPGLIHHGLFADQPEIKELVRHNRRLPATHVALGQDLVSSKEEIQRHVDHIKRTRTESDIHIRVSMDKIAKMEVGSIHYGVTFTAEGSSNLPRVTSAHWLKLLTIKNNTNATPSENLSGQKDNSPVPLYPGPVAACPCKHSAAHMQPTALTQHDSNCAAHSELPSPTARPNKNCPI
ncbi:hypothetical protein M9H77_21093 [Catharanthus roseus]|uniref:Uncharacterized protein n=1 Tax=Catharanthus roseus TaxID=4058 RepID=A0ACC0AN22_CATRO|nr:hypothetical protein M9H77_21093 [Catharanthus roseus]